MFASKREKNAAGLAQEIAKDEKKSSREKKWVLIPTKHKKGKNCCARISDHLCIKNFSILQVFCVMNWKFYLVSLCLPFLYLPMPQSRHLTISSSSSTRVLPQKEHCWHKTLFPFFISVFRLSYYLLWIPDFSDKLLIFSYFLMQHLGSCLFLNLRTPKASIIGLDLITSESRVFSPAQIFCR